MSPPPALEHAAGQAVPVVVRPIRKAPWNLLGRLLERASDASWRLLADLVALYVASGVALLGSGAPRASADTALIALLFPPFVLVLLRTWRSPDRQMNASAIDTATHVLGAVSLAAMLAVAWDSIFGGHHPVTIALRLWVFALVLLGIARVAFVFALR